MPRINKTERFDIRAEGKLESLINKITDITHSHPEISDWTYYTEGDYDDGYYLFIAGVRAETDEEMEDRERIQEKYKKQQEKWEREQLNALLKKFGKVAIDDNARPD